MNFRGLTLEKKWVYGDLLNNPCATRIVQNFALVCDPVTHNNVELTGCSGVFFLVDKKTVGRQTGMFDANGNEVYEGDIVRNVDNRCLQEVFWNNDEASWFCKYIDDEKRIVSLSDSLGNLNVMVGNIHEDKLLS